jgi:hypothetical protein
MPRRPTTITRTVEQAGTTEPATSAETVVATLSQISPDDTTPKIVLSGSCNVIGGTTATTVVVRIRRGTTTAGTLVSKALTSPLAAAASLAVLIEALDQVTEESASLAYVMTIEQPSASANPKVTGAVLSATF